MVSDEEAAHSSVVEPAQARGAGGHHAASNERPLVKVWDGFVRGFHWALVVACALAWFSHGGLPRTHRVAGYVVAGLVIARLVWGFVGSQHARFASFVPLTLRLLAYAGAMLRGRERRFLGHNPAGSVMILALLGVLCLVGASGVLIDYPSWRDFRPLQELHAAASDVLMVLAGVHVLGVLYASLRHRENLVKSMFTGTKRVADSGRDS